jgi:hypothetical protein
MVVPTHFDEGLTEGGHFLGCGVESARSASAVEDMANFIIWEIKRTKPLCLGKESFLEKKMWAPAQLQPIDSL